jgi:hypothetical protein
MKTQKHYSTHQRNLLLLGAVLVIVGTFLPWEIEGDFISTWRYGIQFFPVFSDNGGILVLLISVFIIWLIFRSKGFVKYPDKWVFTSSIALFLISAYHIVDWLFRRISANGVIGAPAIRTGLILVGIGSILILVTTFLMNSKESVKHVQQ